MLIKDSKSFIADYRQPLLELLLFSFFIVCLLPKYAHGYDMYCWIRWAQFINENGITEVYRSDANYPPLYLYFLWFYDLFQSSGEKIAENSNYLKLFPLAFDLLPVLFLILMRKAEVFKKNDHLLLLFNIAYFYNTLVWGQTDSIHSCLCLMAVFLASGYPVVAVLLFVLALNMKFQSVIFLPVLILCLLGEVKTLRKILALLGAGLLLQILLLLPFLLSGTAAGFWSVLTHAVGYWPLVSMNAFNFWYLIMEKNPFTTPDTEIFFLFSYKAWGLFLFLIFSTLVLLPLFIRTIHRVLYGKKEDNDQELAFLTGGMVTLVFFYFNSEMHERYAHPAMIFFFFYGLSRRNFLLYFLVSLACFLNLEKVLEYYFTLKTEGLFVYRMISCVYMGVIITGVFALYRDYGIRRDWSLLSQLLRLSVKDKG